MKTQHTKIAAIATFLSLIFAGCSNNTSEEISESAEKQEEKAQVEAESRKYGGTFSFGDDIEKEAVGEIRIYPLTKSSALFFINVNRGAPSYNMGLLSGEMIIEDGIGIYESKDQYIDCKLTFKFLEDELHVSTGEGKDNCGFGHAVYADHIYKLTNSEIPQYYLSGEGDTLYFESLIKN